MKKLHSILVVSFLLGMIHAVSGQSLPEPASVIPLYEGVAPGSENWDWEENTAVSYRGLPIVQNVVKPVQKKAVSSHTHSKSTESPFRTAISIGLAL